MIFDDIKSSYPYFYKASVYLEDSAFFFKTVLTDLRSLDIDYEYCENLCEKGFVLSNRDWDKYYQNLYALVLFSLEFLKLQVEMIKKKGVPVLLHSDGNIRGIMEDIIDAGFDGIQSIEPAAGMRIDEIKVKYGDQLVLMGNIDISEILPRDPMK